MEGVRDGGTFEGIGEPAEEKTILEPPSEPDLGTDDLGTRLGAGGGDPAESGAEDAGELGTGR